MERNLRLPKDIKSITVLKVDGDGESVTVYKAKKKRKKQSAGLKPIERWARRNMMAQQTFADTYLKKHEGSNGKRRDGWLRDLGTNLLRANRRAGKKLKIVKLLGW